jgi:hypothetical protein
MSTPAQAAANQANAQHSCGPKTDSGKAASSKNNFRFGFTGAFAILESEDEAEFNLLAASLQDEHQPSTITEHLLVQKMAQHYWLSRRAILLQTSRLDDEKQFALFLRYQTTNDRGFHTCLNTLLKLRAEKRKAEIGFESQKRREAEEARRQSNETRKQDLHQWAVLLAEAKVDHQQALTLNAKLPQAIAAAKEESRAQIQEAA